MTHILQAQNEYAEEFLEGETGSVVKWTFPKGAKIGDKAFIYSGLHGIFATCKILSEAEPADAWGWKGRYGGDVGGFSVLRYFVPLQYIKAEMPEFGWAKYPRSYTTLDDPVANQFESMLEAYEDDSGDLEADSVEPAIEGARHRVFVNLYERSRRAREECKQHHKSICSVCGFNFGQVYGPTFNGYIHVHHLIPISQLGADYSIDPITDLIPVCPNCHAVIHSQTPPLTPEAVRKLIRKNNKV